MTDNSGDSCRRPQVLPTAPVYVILHPDPPFLETHDQPLPAGVPAGDQSSSGCVARASTASVPRFKHGSSAKTLLVPGLNLACLFAERSSGLPPWLGLHHGTVCHVWGLRGEQCGTDVQQMQFGRMADTDSVGPPPFAVPLSGLTQPRSLTHTPLSPMGSPASPSPSSMTPWSSCSRTQRSSRNGCARCVTHSHHTPHSDECEYCCW